MRPVDWSQTALDDLRAINDWLTEQADPAVALRLLTTVRTRASFLEQFPRGGRLHRGDTRVLRVLGTPYLLLYRLDGETVQVLRVRHERQDWPSP